VPGTTELRHEIAPDDVGLPLTAARDCIRLSLVAQGLAVLSDDELWQIIARP
jgi:hypothetical protein